MEVIVMTVGGLIAVFCIVDSVRHVWKKYVASAPPPVRPPAVSTAAAVEYLAPSEVLVQEFAAEVHSVRGRARPSTEAVRSGGLEYAAAVQGWYAALPPALLTGAYALGQECATRVVVEDLHVRRYRELHWRAYRFLREQESAPSQLLVANS